MRNGHETATNIAVVGAGLAGLTAAAYVARAGHPVTVFERSSRLGGRADTHDQRGFLFNYGPHALYAKGPAVDVLRELGVSFAGRKPPVSGYFLRDGILHALNPVALVTTSLLSASGKFAAMRALASVYRAKPGSAASASWREWSNDRCSNDGARDLLDALVRVSTYANDPERLSAEVALMQLQTGARHGVLYLDGGWQTLVDGLRAAAERAGACILADAPVAGIDYDADGVRSVRLSDGSFIAASSVIIAGSPQLAAQFVPGSEDLQSLAAQSIPVRAACLDLGFRRLPIPKQRFSLGVDKPYYFSQHSGIAQLAPDGRSLVQVAKYLATEDASDATSLERELEAFVDIVQPGWRDELIERRFLPNMVVVNALATAQKGGLAGRPSPDATGIPGVYVAGDWVGSEGWLSDASFASGKRAAELAMRSASAEPVGIARATAYA
jgi:phytoene dehydrogenase-like protein